MKVLVLYRPNSEFARPTETFVHDFEHQHEALASAVELIDIDSRNGAATASVYDVVVHPTILVVANDGQLIKSWERTFPLLDELSGYLVRG